MENKAELIPFLKELSNCELDYIETKEKEDLKKKFGEYHLIDEEGNSEGGGEYSHLVYEFKELGCFVKVTGCYTSYSGTDWENDWKEVQPKEKTITVYE